VVDGDHAGGGAQRGQTLGEQLNQVAHTRARGERTIEAIGLRSLTIRGEKSHSDTDFLGFWSRFGHTMSIGVPALMPGRDGCVAANCQRIGVGGVLPVNDQSLSEPDVVNLAAMVPEARSTSSNDSRFDRLFGHFYPELFGLVYRVLGDRMETEDTLQDVFLKLSDQPELQERPDPEIGAWLRRVGLNVAFNRLRTARRARTRLERVGRLERSDEEPVEHELASPSGLVVRQEERAAVRRVLAEIPERQRECLLLRHSGYSYAEIAATLGIAVGSVGVLLSRAEHVFRTTYRRQIQP